MQKDETIIDKTVLVVDSSTAAIEGGVLENSTPNDKGVRSPTEGNASIDVGKANEKKGRKKKKSKRGNASASDPSMVVLEGKDDEEILNLILASMNQNSTIEVSAGLGNLVEEARRSILSSDDSNDRALVLGSSTLSDVVEEALTSARAVGASGKHTSATVKKLLLNLKNFLLEYSNNNINQNMDDNRKKKTKSKKSLSSDSSSSQAGDRNHVTGIPSISAPNAIIRGFDTWLPQAMAVLRSFESSSVGAADVFVSAGGIAVLRAVLGLEGGCMRGPTEWAAVWLQDTSCTSISGILQILTRPKYVVHLLKDGVIACVFDVCKVLLKGLEMCQVRKAVKANVRHNRRPSKIDPSVKASALSEPDVNLMDVPSSPDKRKVEPTFPQELRALPACLDIICCYMAYSSTEASDSRGDTIFMKSKCFSDWLKDIVKALIDAQSSRLFDVEDTANYMNLKKDLFTTFSR